MGGPNTKPSQQLYSQQIAQAGRENQISEQALGLSTEDRQRSLDLINQGLTLFQPGINFQSALASGDRSKMVAAAAPLITEFSQQGKQAREQAYQMPRGAGQEFALAVAPQMQANAVAGALGQAYTSSFDKLLGIGQGVIGVGQGIGEQSLQEMGASLRGAEGATASLASAGQTQRDLMQAQAAKKQATMGFLGSLVGAGASMATGGVFGALGKTPGQGGSTVNKAGIAFPSQNPLAYSMG